VLKAVQLALGLAIAALNLWFWFRVVRTEPRFRAWVERRYGVVITLRYRSHWKVSGSGSRLFDFALGWLQLAYYMAAYVVWAAGMLVIIGLCSLLQRAE
jgi:hypothetical protein